MTFESGHFRAVFAMGGKLVIFHSRQPRARKATKISQDISYRSAIDFDFRVAISDLYFRWAENVLFPTPVAGS